MAKSKSKKTRKTVKSLQRQLTALKGDLKELVMALQQQQQLIGQIAQGESLPGAGGMTAQQYANIQQGFAPNWEQSYQQYQTAQSQQTQQQQQLQAEKPVDPEAITVQVPTRDSLAKIVAQSKALQSACIGDPNANNQFIPGSTNMDIRNQYDRQELVYDPGKKKFYDTYCDAFADGADPAQIYTVDEDLLRSRLRNAGETGPYTAEELGQDVQAKKRKEKPKKACATSPQQVPNSLLDLGGGYGYSETENTTYRTFMPNGTNVYYSSRKTSDQPEFAGLWYIDICPGLTPPPATSQKGTKESPMLNFPKEIDSVQVWIEQYGYMGKPGPDRARPDNITYDPSLDEVVGERADGSKIWLCGSGPKVGQEVNDRSECAKK